mgnify:CR=1 FL=1
MKKLIAFLALAFTAGCAEVEMRGIVREQGSGEPLPGATVRVGDRSTTTDLTGYYNLEVDESDEPKQIFVDKAGYESFTEQVTIDDDDMEEIFQDIELKKEQREGSQLGETRTEGDSHEGRGSLDQEHDD